MNKKYDLGIVGSGPAGYTAVLHGSKKGLKVVLFEKAELGGVCLNRGCIPTKAILHCAEVFEEIQSAKALGIEISDTKVNFAEVIERKNQIVSKLRKGLELTIKNSGIEVVKGEAKIINKNTISANSNTYDCNQIIAATGSEPRILRGMEFNHTNILSSDDILNLDKLPKSIVIVGSGAIGIEWARIFSGFGVEVSIVELADNLLPVADIEVSKRIERIFKTKKIKIFKSVKVEKIEGEKVHLSNGEIIEGEKVLVAAGREVKDFQKIEGVKYIGDVCGEIQLAHYASKQAIEVIDGIKFDKSLVPSVVYGNPEIAWIGKREQDLEEGSYKKSFMLISALGKSHCDNSPDGFIKILVQNDKIVGAHIISKEASSLIQQILIAIQNGITVEKLKEVCFAHPTYSEGIFESLFGL